MKKSILLKFTTFVTTLFLISSCNSSNEKMGNYKKEKLPSGFHYQIVSDESNKNLDKNQLTVEIDKKLSEGQIATLAQELYESKDEQKRFYIFYKLKNVDNGLVAWATSHFDPNLEIIINGSSSNEDNSMFQNAKKVEGELLGIYDEKEYTFALYSVYKSNGNLFVKTSFKNGQSMIDEMVGTNIKSGTKLISKDGGNQGEYYILKGNILEFYNKENNKFTEANKLE